MKKMFFFLILSLTMVLAVSCDDAGDDNGYYTGTLTVNSTTPAAGSVLEDTDDVTFNVSYEIEDFDPTVEYYIKICIVESDVFYPVILKTIDISTTSGDLDITIEEAINTFNDDPNAPALTPYHFVLKFNRRFKETYSYFIDSKYVLFEAP